MISEFPSVCSRIYQQEDEHKHQRAEPKLPLIFAARQENLIKIFAENFHRKLANGFVL